VSVVVDVDLSSAVVSYRPAASVERAVSAETVSPVHCSKLRLGASVFGT
jgi:hypothetical protein